MTIPCENAIKCDCTQNPLSGYSSQDEDQRVYLGVSFGYDDLPLLNTNQVLDICSGFAASVESQELADLIAESDRLQCVAGSPLDNPLATFLNPV